MMRLPEHLAGRSRIAPFLRGCELVEMLDAGDYIILNIADYDEEEQYGGAWEEGSGWLAGMMPLRADILSGDWRMLYLAWLWSVDAGHVRDEALEPLPGIAPLTGALSTFAEFFRIDTGLVAAAAELSAGIAEDLSSKKFIQATISKLSNAKKQICCIGLPKATRMSQSKSSNCLGKTRRRKRKLFR